MAKFPDPPPVNDLKKIPPQIVTLEKGAPVARIFSSGGEHPGVWDDFRFFGPTASRFDHHLPDAANKPHQQKRGIIYLASGEEMIPTCLAECFQATRIIDRHRNSPTLCGFETAADIQLLDLTGTFTTKMGASMEINSGPRPRARRWAQALYQAYPNIHGILYSSSMYGNQPSIALFERAKFVFAKRPIIHKQLNDPSLFSVISATGAHIDYQVV